MTDKEMEYWLSGRHTNLPPLMANKEKIERLEKTLKTFIAWSASHLGEESVRELLEMLEDTDTLSS